MIRYAITASELETLVDQHDSTWRERARRRTGRFRQLGRYEEKSSMSNFFPIYGPRGAQSEDSRSLASERPLLIYPLGDLDDDPESLITFLGILPVPVRRRGYPAYRARVTIDFFALAVREELLLQRAEQLEKMKFAFIVQETATDPRALRDAATLITRLQQRSSPHCSCARAFYALYQQDRRLADELYGKITAYLSRRS